MSKVIKPVILDSTGREIDKKLHNQNVLLDVLAGTAFEEIPPLSNLTFKQIQRIVQSGRASLYFNIGDQIIIPWTDSSSGVTYQVPFDVAHIGTADNVVDTDPVPAMYLQWHCTTPFSIPFIMVTGTDYDYSPVWSESYIRDWLNDTFMSGFENDFLSILHLTRVVNCDGGDTFDTFYLPSLNNMNIETGVSDYKAEGVVFDYWKNLSAYTSAQVFEAGNSYDELKFLTVESQTNKGVLFRSSVSGTAGMVIPDTYQVWTINTSGTPRVTNISIHSAGSDDLRCTPVCVIC